MKKYLLYFFIISSTFLEACAQEAKPVQRPLPENYVIILDLSDRLLSNGQSEKDIAVIRTLFARYEKAVRRNLVIKSTDRFQVRIIPQQGSRLNAEAWEDRLSLDIKKWPMSERAAKLKSHGAQLENLLRNLYADAHQGNTRADYAGADTWAYFHDKASRDFVPGFKNCYIVLTDGYLDFEQPRPGLRKSNRYTSTVFLKSMNGARWLEHAQEQDMGLLPVQLPAEARWMVVGIRSKKPDDLLQHEKLKYVWTKWLTESGVRHTELVLDGSMGSLVDGVNRISFQ